MATCADDVEATENTASKERTVKREDMAVPFMGSFEFGEPEMAVEEALKYGNECR
jgi:hypothetical protein